ncbi:putative acyl-CoA transferase/carnitine dehydratase [Mesotoga prima MesG1.Ag.4.2]|uniref:Putative acyl-CoA transferase/carnitine dehydratase n=1 Tax=Mesotoga prima MesG1.Ag.4.2 TaxID=660470 RepID=I2F510_9BACT|nr:MULTISPECIES: CaiB/BaiF CoA-transferase family protein [Mesotoga]AFK07013.1 putative acyl-CoA transferase/carnitine dehydratase [Mesotoga prima MesG1.Ag.4.2]HNQ70721.1 CaiB/BaiF CoA-transferase family protein [Mesotoga prima]HPE53354.1 CaiB/BaiF CoA-transferase family protein [Mesotoga prima]HRX65014.1 CaiB/BaiF CoA-transferase family protein [Mesotoga sp.]HUM22040.1 CaiB/BaiF CoA-transferase family protein [Mesotoga prima]
MSKPLEGISVLDLTRVLAGPFCTMLLCDMGANVVKVERPEGGDDSRSFSPFVGDDSAYFMSINRGKKSITLNLKTVEGKKLLERLIERFDVLVENFRPGVFERLGFSAQRLREINPRLIYTCSSGFGHSGPMSHRTAYDLIIQGLSGMMSITGPDENSPTKVGSSIADIFCGTFACIGILAALHSRNLTGKGQKVDVAMLDSMVSVLENAIARYAATGEPPVPIGNRHPSIAPFASFKTLDGIINIAVGNDVLWEKFCKAIGRPEMCDDPKFVNNPARVRNLEELMEILGGELEKRTSDEWLGVFGKLDIPSGKINNIADIFEDEQIRAREMIVEVPHRCGNVKMPGVPIKFSDTPASIAGPAPLLGEHNREVYAGMLGLSDLEMEELKRKGII